MKSHCGFRYGILDFQIRILDSDREDHKGAGIKAGWLGRCGGSASQKFLPARCCPRRTHSQAKAGEGRASLGDPSRARPRSETSTPLFRELAGRRHETKRR